MVERIQKKIWQLSFSAGITPYTFLSVRIGPAIRALLSQDDLGGFSQCLAFFVWESYSLEEYRDYVLNSKEYLSIPDKIYKKAYLEQQLARQKATDELRQWQNNQLQIAVGIALHEIQKCNMTYKKADLHQINLLKPVIKTTGGILSEVILLK